MKAVVYFGPGDIRIEKRPEPVLRDDNLLAKVKCCAICGTDLKLATVGNPRCRPPRIIGHEFTAEIMKVGSNVKGFAPGDRVTMATTVSCGECRLCRMGLNNMCGTAKPVSYDFDGAFAEYMTIPPEAITGGNVIKLPDNVPDAAGALSEPLSCAVNSQEISGVKAVDSVLIIGGGPLGAIHAELAKANGAKTVMIVQRSKPRQSMLKELDNVTVFGETEAMDAVMELTQGLGADHVIVCAPNKEAQENSLKLARKGGSVNFFASLSKDAAVIEIDSRLVHYSELRISGASDSRPEHVEKAAQLLSAGKINWEKLITHQLPLENFDKGIELMKNKQCLKVLLYPDLCKGAEQ